MDPLEQNQISLQHTGQFQLEIEIEVLSWLEHLQNEDKAGHGQISSGVRTVKYKILILICW